MTTAKLSQYIGRRTMVQGATEGEYATECLVEDARLMFDRVEVLVSPLAGRGSRWVTLARTDLEAAKP